MIEQKEPRPSYDSFLVAAGRVDDLSPMGVQSHGHGQMKAARRPTAIVVNDDRIQLRLASALLEDDGMKVLPCHNADEALQLLRERGPVDVIVTDLYMPGIDGWRFCRLLRSPEYAALNHIPVLVMSATFSGADAEQVTADLGANAFLSAPYSPTAFRASVRALLEGRASKATVQALIVEDDHVQSMVLQHALQAHGYTVSAAFTAGDARRLFYKHRPDIVILNHQLPDLAGDSLLEELKQPGASTVAIAVTADPRPETALQLVRKGADGYVQKPFDPRYLIELCERARRERSLLRVEELLEERTQKLRQMEMELLKAQKLESIGRLAGAIAHDFNSVMTGIMGHLSLAKLAARPEDAIFESLTAAEAAAQRAKELTQRFLTFSESGAPVKKAASVRSLLKDAVAMAPSGETTRCTISLADDLWSVEVDEGHISQVIQNMIANADEAMPQGGLVQLRAENVTVGGDQALPLKPSKYVAIAIEDLGAGIPPEHLPKIFDPYFTTKPEGRGLGLAIAYAIVRKHEGHITVDSTPGTGTTFTIYLPASVGNGAGKNGDAKLFTGKGAVLVMDDEDIIRDVLGKMLTRLGYEPAFARDGAEAIDLYKKAQSNGQPFEAVVLDLNIPGGIGGKEAVKKLQEIDPQVRAIVSSGYSNDVTMNSFKEYGFCGRLQKPYKIQTLGQVLQDALSLAA